MTDLRTLLGLRDLVRRVKPDLVHTHSTKAGLLGRWAAALAGVPAVHTAHSWSFSDGVSSSRRALAVPVEAVTARLTRRIIAVSDADREVAERWHVARGERVTVVHNGVADVPERAEPDAAGPPTLAMVARLAPPKDHALLLHALGGLKDLPWRVALVGDGPGRATIEATVARLGIADRVDLLGLRRDVPAVLARAHVGALISRQEGFPLAVLEAMRAGLPVIASDVGGAREAVTAETGLLVARDDEAGLRDALRRVLSTPALRRSLGDAGRRRYEERFTAAAMITRTLDVYAKAVGAVAR